MVLKYVATLTIVVTLITLGLTSLQFATGSQVRSGSAVEENLQLEFTIDADSSHTYEISPSMARFLEYAITIRTEGAAHIVSSDVDVTPKDVSWTENHETITSPGAAMSIHLKWDTPADSANGARGTIYLDFPEIPGLTTQTITLHSGGYQKKDAGHYVIGQVTTYQSGFRLALARFFFALAAGLPFGILLHAIGWIFVLKAERRSRIAAFPPQGPGLPRTFYPYPIAQWGLWLLLFGIGSAVASLMAGLSVHNGFMSSSIIWAIYIILAVAAAGASMAAYFRGKSLLTVRIESTGIAYAHGRGDLQWVTANWGEILTLMEKSRTYRGSTSFWLEVDFQDNRKILKLDQSIEGYAELRNLLASVYHR